MKHKQQSCHKSSTIVDHKKKPAAQKLSFHAICRSWWNPIRATSQCFADVASWGPTLYCIQKGSEEKRISLYLKNTPAWKSIILVCFWSIFKRVPFYFRDLPRRGHLVARHMDCLQTTCRALCQSTHSVAWDSCAAKQSHFSEWKKKMGCKISHEVKAGPPWGYFSHLWS